MTQTGPTQRWALLLEYHGGRFVGWQRQKTGLSVQAVLEAAASRLCGGRAVGSTVAGRTDAGVHARGQVAHLELPAGAFAPDRLRDALNFHMKPHPVTVLRAATVPDDWSARFSAVRRRYLYRISNRAARPALDQGLVWHVRQPLDIDAMRHAAAALLGRHDFTSFRASACQADSPLRTLDLLELSRSGDTVLVRAEARSFLHHQVRNMVGTLKLVGTGDWAPARVGAVLAARDRALAGPTAPADGLALLGVDYPLDPFAGTAGATPRPAP